MESVFLKVHEILKERNLQDSVMLTSLTGSRLYGLDTPDSDFDVHVVVFQKLQKGFYHEYEDFDLTIISYDVFLEGLTEAAPVSVDILFSETSEISTTFESFLKSYRVSAQRYAAHSRRLAELDFLKSEKVSEARGKKALKVCCRELMLAERAERLGVIRPRFTKTENEKFRKLYEASLKLEKNTKNFYKLQKMIREGE